MIFHELRHEPVDDALVQIVPTEMGITRRGLDLDYIITDLEDGDIDGPSPEVVDCHHLILFLIKPIGQR